jgi:hypothetical protein
VLVEELLRRQLVFPEAAVGDVAVELLRVRRAPALRLAVLAAPAGKRSDAGAALVPDNVILVAARIARRAARIDKGWQAEFCAEFD